MTQNEFIILMQNIKKTPPIDTAKIQFIEKRFNELGYTKTIGYQSMQYYFDELEKAYTGKETIFKGNVVKLKDSWGIVDASAYFVIKYKEWDNLKEIIKNHKEDATFTDNIGQKEERAVDKVTFTANELALTYIFDLMATGEQIPINRIEGGLSKKDIEIQGEKYINDNIDSLKFRTPNAFYKAVKRINENHDLNKNRDLKAISKDWINAITVLSNNWKETKQYLINKKLIEG